MPEVLGYSPIVGVGVVDVRTSELDSRPRPRFCKVTALSQEDVVLVRDAFVVSAGSVVEMGSGTVDGTPKVVLVGYLHPS